MMNDITAGLVETAEDIAKRNNQFLPELNWQEVDVSKNYLDVTLQYDSPRYSLLINNTPCAPVGGLHVITGQPGNGKTNAQSQIIAAYLGDTSHNMAYNLADRPEPKVLYVDTEMEPENTMMVNLRVCAMTEREYHKKYEDFDILVLRNELSAEDRWLKILKAIYEKQPNAVFIDGMIDIVADFNDNRQCQEIIFKCMALATYYDINLWTTIHQNPGTTKMTGHAGSFLERKATDIFQITKDKSSGEILFLIEQTKARGKDVPEVRFRMSTMAGKYPFAIPETINQDASTAIKQLATFLINNESKFTWPVSKKELKDRMVGGTNQKAKNVDIMVEQGFITESDKKRGGYPAWDFNKSKCEEFLNEAPF